MEKLKSGGGKFFINQINDELANEHRQTLDRQFCSLILLITMKNKSTKYTSTIPKTVSVRELQRTYRVVNDKLNQEGVLLVMNYSKPEMVLVSKKKYEAMQKKINKLEEELEIQDTLRAYAEAKLDEKEGRLIKLNSLAELRLEK